jgi:hypothetical protein
MYWEAIMPVGVVLRAVWNKRGGSRSAGGFWTGHVLHAPVPAVLSGTAYDTPDQAQAEALDFYHQFVASAVRP